MARYSVLYAFFLIASCNSSGLGGSGSSSGFSSTSGNTESANDSKNQESNESPQPADTGTGGSDQNGAGTVQVQGTTDNGLAGQYECLQKKSLNYNFVLIFDASGSQKESDPEVVRGSVAKDFIDKFDQLVARKPSTVVQAAIVRFAANATTGPWQALDGKGSPAIKSAIDLATDKNSLDGGTNYQDAFAKAQTALANLGAKVGDLQTRNYVLFMSDGAPNQGSYTVDNIKKSVVDPYKSAIISIATGSGKDSKGNPVIGADQETKIRELAMPASGDPQGRYYRAASASDLRNAWSDFFKDLATCKNTQ